MSLGIDANKTKNGALLAYIAYKIPNINLRKLLKLVYLIDEYSVKERCFPITWFNYVAWEKGPVAPEVYAVKNNAFDNYVYCQKNAQGQNIIIPIEKEPYLMEKQMEDFSSYEMDLIDKLIDNYGNLSADDLSNMTHETDSLWSQICKEQRVVFVDGKSNVTLPLTRLNGDDTRKNEIYSEAEWNMNFQASLNKH